MAVLWVDLVHSVHANGSLAQLTERRVVAWMRRSVEHTYNDKAFVSTALFLPSSKVDSHKNKRTLARVGCCGSCFRRCLGAAFA